MIPVASASVAAKTVLLASLKESIPAVTVAAAEAARSRGYHHVATVRTTSCIGTDAVVPSSLCTDQRHLLQHSQHQQWQWQWQDQQRREKHSSTQIKRIFRKNPARIRVEERIYGIDRNNVAANAESLLPPPKYEAVFSPTFLTNGWSAPPPDDVLSNIPEYPFRITRTKNKPLDAVGFLPVYAKYRKDGTKATTIIRKVSGDQEFFLQELRSVLKLPKPIHGNPRDDDIRIRTGGTIEVNGNRVREIKMWLAGLGF